jgi:hypothetical protein
MYGTKQAARKWHKHVSDLMIKNGCFAVNSEKDYFQEDQGTD